MSGDAVSIAPDIYKVVLDNERVRILEVRMKTGQVSAMHSHPDTVVIGVVGAKYRFTHPEGEPLEREHRRQRRPRFHHRAEVGARRAVSPQGGS